MCDLQVLYHGNCFDGALSAAIFSRFYRDAVQPGARVCYRGMAHGPTDPFGPDHALTFHAPENAVLDFRYSPSPRLTWWCDHHATAFMAPEHQAHFEAERSAQKHFDPSAPSCAGLLCRWLAADHGYQNPLFVQHARWADLVDSAAFESPTQAVELKEPALRLTALLESAPGDELCTWLIEQLGRRPIAEVAGEPRVERALGPVLREHQRTIEVFRRRMELERGVATFDLVEEGVEGFNKFIPYYLAEGVRYTVGLTLSARRAKVSVGSNPWQRPEPLEDIGALCRRFGGGGHKVVGAVSLGPHEIAEAREAYQVIVAELKASTPA